MTSLITKFLAVIWFILGLLFLIFPSFAKGFLLFLSKKHIKKALFAIIFLLLTTIFQVFFKRWSLLVIIMFIVLFIALFRLFLTIRKKAVDYADRWLEKIPAIWYRALGLAIGVSAYLILRFSA